AGTSLTYQIDWDGDGTVDQSVTGPSGTTVTHVFTTTGVFNVDVTAADSAGNVSQPVSLGVQIVTATLEADPTDPNKTALFVGGTLGDDWIGIAPSDLEGGLHVRVNCEDAG